MEIREGIVKSNEIKNGDVIIIQVTKNEVKMNATYRLEQQINELKKIGTNAKNILAISFLGYDFDEREVYEIPEVQDYLKTLINNVPELFYFIDIGSYTFAIIANAIFTDFSQVDDVDNAIIDYAKSIEDNGRVITVSYYVPRHQQLVLEYSNR